MARPRWWTLSLDLLGARRCRALRDTVHELQHRWVVRHPHAPFYTLGRAAYLDASGHRAARYAQLAAEENPVLQEAFGDLLEDVRCVLEAVVDAPVRYDPALALPGFHVFLAHELTRTLTARVHFDLQHTELGLAEHGEDGRESVLSFTLPVALPRHGGGLDVWNLHRAEVPLAARADLSRLVASRAHHVEPYRVGHLVVHSGCFAHRIAPTPRMSALDERITLQGHAVRTPDGWVAYW